MQFLNKCKSAMVLTSVLAAGALAPSFLAAQQLNKVPGAFVLHFPSKENRSWGDLEKEMQTAITELRNQPLSYVAPSGAKALVFSDLYPDLSCAAAWPAGKGGLSTLHGHSEKSQITGHFQELGSYFAAGDPPDCPPDNDLTLVSAGTSEAVKVVDTVLRFEIPINRDRAQSSKIGEMETQYFWSMFFSKPFRKKFNVFVCPVLRSPNNPVGAWHIIQGTSELVRERLDLRSRPFRLANSVNVHTGRVAIESPRDVPLSEYGNDKNLYIEILITQSENVDSQNACGQKGRLMFDPNQSLRINWLQSGGSDLDFVLTEEKQLSPTSLLDEVVRRSHSQSKSARKFASVSYGQGTFIVEGYADTLTGTKTENLAVSELRANQVSKLFRSALATSDNNDVGLVSGGFGMTDRFDKVAQSTSMPNIQVFEGFKFGDYGTFGTSEVDANARPNTVLASNNRTVYLTWLPFQEPPETETTVAASKWLAAQRIAYASEVLDRPACVTENKFNSVLFDLDSIVEYFYSDEYIEYSDIAAHSNSMVLVCSGRELDVKGNYLRSGYLRPEVVAPHLLRSMSDKKVAEWPKKIQELKNQTSFSPLYEISNGDTRSFILFGDTILAHFFQGTTVSSLINSSFCKLGIGHRLRVVHRDSELDYCDPELQSRMEIAGQTNIEDGLYDIHIPRRQSEAVYCSADHSVFKPAGVDESGNETAVTLPALDRDHCSPDGSFPNVFEVFDRLTAQKEDGTPIFGFLLRAAVDVTYEFSTALSKTKN